MKRFASLLVALSLGACAAAVEQDDRGEETAIADFIAVNELAPVGSIRTMDQLASEEVSERYVLVSTRRQDYLLEYFTRCLTDFDRRVRADVRGDSRALYARADTFRGCRIKTIYTLTAGQADEVRQLGRTVGGER